MLIGGGVLGFIQYLISRHDKKKETQNETLSIVKKLAKRMDKLESKQEQRDALSCRNHILRFNDELMNNIDHSHEYFMEMMDDIEAYNKYCDGHPEFKNGRTVQAAKNIKYVYNKLRNKGAFDPQPKKGSENNG